MVYDGVAVNILSVVYRVASRFLKNVDLCSEVIRAKSGRLLFDDDNLGWIHFSTGGSRLYFGFHVEF